MEGATFPLDYEPVVKLTVSVDETKCRTTTPFRRSKPTPILVLYRDRLQDRRHFRRVDEPEILNVSNTMILMDITLF